MTLIVFGVVALFRVGGKGHRSPLTRELLRSPGESLRAQIEDISINIDSFLVVTVTVPVVIYSTYLSQMYFVGGKQSDFLIVIYLLLGGLHTLFWAVKILRLLKQRRSLYLGLDCELSVGQELSQLMLQGYRVYHDFPADKFNIDHIVVGPKGVFAIETKGRTKPDKEGGTEEAKVIFDGSTLKFPNWSEVEPIDQARRQAAWLAKWLSSAVGDPLSVHPVLALPGWYIVNERLSDVITFSGKKPNYILNFSKDTLSENEIQRIAHQLEQRCRDVKMGAYSKKTKEK